MSEQRYNIFVTLAFSAFTGIIFLSVYFLMQYIRILILAYLILVLIYAGLFLTFICPVCGTRHIYPGGKTTTILKDKFFDS